MSKITKKEAKKLAAKPNSVKLPFFPQPKQKAIRRPQGR
jgi:hypothetical protein